MEASSNNLNLTYVRQIQDALGGLTKFTYDTNGNLLTVTDAKNQTTTYTYDEMDRLKTRTDALSRTESYQYDPNGNLTKFTDRKSQVATFSYDSLNRRSGATYPDATVTFGYDAIGRLTSVSDSVGGNITWTYDTVSGGHHPRVQETTTPGTVTVEYDEIGRRLKLSATGQTDVTYTYDKNSRLKTVTQGTQTVTLAYDDVGRRTTLTYPNGVVTSYGYDNANRLLSIDHVKAPTTVEALTYVYDAAGNRTKLTRANAAATLVPDAVSNTDYDAANQQIRFNSGSQNLAYDSNGNFTSFTDASGATTYTWNARNQLTAISGPSLSASFVYDGLGRRTSKTINSTTTGFWYDGSDGLAELSGSTPTATYIRGLSIDEPFIRKQAGGDEFYQTDALGTTVALTDGAGASNTTYTQEPFGKTTKTGTSTNAFQYTGREEDGTGITYYRARYYSPKLQRFVSEDPLRPDSEMNSLYAYVLNDPINLTDPLGLKPPRHIPAAVDICKNLQEAAGMFTLSWVNKVREHGDWDYKKQDPKFEDFGNYHYAITARAIGFSPDTIRRAAGAVQVLQGYLNPGRYDPRHGRPYLFAPYGDDPFDQAWINEGIRDYDTGFWKERCQCRNR